RSRLTTTFSLSSCQSAGPGSTVTSAPKTLASANSGRRSAVVSSTAGPSWRANSARRATLGRPRRRPAAVLVRGSLVVMVGVVQGGAVGGVARGAQRRERAAQEPTPNPGRGESRGRLLGGEAAQGGLGVVVLGVRARPHDDHDLAARRRRGEAGRQLAERAPHRLLVELRDLAAHAGGPRLAAGLGQVAQRLGQAVRRLVDHAGGVARG